ncbi:LysM peptidoglycan-binding domain-containing protein [Flavobacteriaceae bacterium]|nr:LysM peptidoglycan-binding domain-containing protein [Flavobacteriaceae bacterium]
MKHFLIFLGIILFSISSYAQNLKTHNVKTGETVESIAQLYKISTADIYALNPDAFSGIAIDSELIIPESFLDRLNSPLAEREIESYKVHKVRRKETLFSIAQIYNITIQDLKTHNERLRNKKLRSGKKIYIPIFKENSDPAYNSSLQLYTVLAKEGKWRIAYKFGISVPQLEALNPNMGASLNEGQQLNVPNIIISDKKQIEEDQFGYYIVKATEGFYRLEKKLGLSKELLVSLNPELEIEGLKLGMVLRVPKSSVKDIETALVFTTTLSDSLVDLTVKNIGLLLPFKTKSIDTDSLSLAREQLKRDGYINLSTDFYSGVAIAIDSAKQLGISVNLDVFDTNAKALDVKTILNEADFSKYDLILGPITSKNLELTAQHVLKDNIPVVSPFVNSKKSYSNLFQTIPDLDWMRSKMVSYVKTDTIPHRTLIIYDSKNTSTVTYLKKAFPSASLITSKTDKDGVEQFYLMLEDVQKVLLPGRTIVFLESNNEGFVSNVTSMLNAMNGLTTLVDDNETEIQRDILLMTTSKNKAFEGKNVSNYDLSNLHFQYPAINFNMELPSTFQEKYLIKFGTFPNKYAIRGFDLTMDLLLRLSKFGTLYERATDIQTSYIGNKFKYTLQPNGGYKNEAGFILKYDDLEIIKVQD